MTNDQLKKVAECWRDSGNIGNIFTDSHSAHYTKLFGGKILEVLNRLEFLEKTIIELYHSKKD